MPLGLMYTLMSRYRYLIDTIDQKTHLDWGFIIGNHLVVECSWEWINTFWKICRIRREMGHRWNIKGERGKNMGWRMVNSRM